MVNFIMFFLLFVAVGVNASGNIFLKENRRCYVGNYISHNVVHKEIPQSALPQTYNPASKGIVKISPLVQFGPVLKLVIM